MDARQAASNVLEAGKSPALAGWLQAIAEATARDGSPRYAPRLCRELARIVVCRNYAKPVLQLCHLVNAADACAPQGESYERLFFGVDKATSWVFRDHVAHVLAERDWRRPGFQYGERGIAIDYAGGGRFEVAWSRMPLLAALLEFMIGMEGYAPVDDIFRGMLQGGADQSAVSDAANALSRRLYAGLAEHLPSVQNMARFNSILAFLRAHEVEGEIEIDDATILAFWLDRSQDSASDDIGFRTYRGAFDGIVAFVRSLELAGGQPDLPRAAPIGADWEEGEIDPDSLSANLFSLESWSSPLAILEEPPADRVKFLTARDRDALRLQLDLGPLAHKLPLSLLRAELFGVVQARLIQAMRQRADAAAIRAKLTPEAGRDYKGHRDSLSLQQARIMTAMKAALHVLLRDRAVTQGDNVASLHGAGPERVYAQALEGPEPASLPGAAAVLEEAAKAFKAIARRGFSEREIEDPEIIDGFREGVGALHAISAEIAEFSETLARLDAGEPDLSGRFTEDREIFSRQFARLYGAEQ